MSTEADIAIAGTDAPAPPDSPIARLYADPWRFGFFQAVRLVYRAERFNAVPTAANPGPLRFATPASLSFPASELDELEAPDEARRQARMTVNFLGLTGPMGVLPRHYTEWMIARRQVRDPAAQDFFDLFNHRLVTLFWQAWAKYRPEIGREFGTGRSALQYVHHIVGMGTPELHKRLYPKPGHAVGARRLPSAALGYFSGLISQRPHGQGSLSQVVSLVVGAPVTVEGCYGSFKAVPERDRSRLGRRAHRLGDGLMLGRRFWDRQTTLLLRVGPLDRDRFAELLPRAGLLGDLVELVRFLTGLALDLRFKFEVRAEAVPRLALGRRDRHGPQLGWNTWLAGRRERRPADESEFHFSAMGEESWR